MREINLERREEGWRRIGEAGLMERQVSQLEVNGWVLPERERDAGRTRGH